MKHITCNKKRVLCVIRLYKEQGASLLLAILILTAILSIAFGVVGLMMGEIKISREVPRSLRAYYVAEVGIERKLYEIRQSADFNDIGAAPDWCNGPGRVPLDSDTFYAVDVTAGTPTTIKSYGCYKGTRRAIEVSY